MAIDWPGFAARIQAHQRFILTSHLRPDCDALGSELGMACVLEALGKEAIIVNADPVPPHLEFIDPRHEIRQLNRDVSPDDLAGYDALMVLDTSAWGQLGAMGDVIRTTKAARFVLDHHVSGDDLKAEVFRDVEAEATGRLIVDAARALGVALTPRMARPLFAALTTDTGWLRFSSVTGDSFRCAAELVDAGVVPAEIYNHLYEQDSLARLHLMGRILARTTEEEGGRLIYSMALNEDFEKTGAVRSDTEDIINRTLTVAGTRVALMFIEQPDGGFKVSFRSRNSIDCSQVAESLGGGGHRAAAGASVDGDSEAALSRVLDVVRAAMR